MRRGETSGPACDWPGMGVHVFGLDRHVALAMSHAKPELPGTGTVYVGGWRDLRQNREVDGPPGDGVISATGGVSCSES